MDDESFQIDPEIAAAMGFSGFGTQPSKKRKIDVDAFVDPSATGELTRNHGKGANSLPLGIRVADRTATDKAQTEEATLSDDRVQQDIRSLSEEDQLQALRQGFRTAEGDMVYFLPSFIEDPWKGLQPK